MQQGKTKAGRAGGLASTGEPGRPSRPGRAALKAGLHRQMSEPIPAASLGGPALPPGQTCSLRELGTASCQGRLPPFLSRYSALQGKMETSQRMGRGRGGCPANSSRTSLGIWVGNGVGRWTRDVQLLPGKFGRINKQVYVKRATTKSPGTRFYGSSEEGPKPAPRCQGMLLRAAPLKAARESLGRQGEGRSSKDTDKRSNGVGERICGAGACLDRGTNNPNS